LLRAVTRRKKEMRGHRLNKKKKKQMGRKKEADAHGQKKDEERR
jgi:hypothetical protein